MNGQHSADRLKAQFEEHAEKVSALGKRDGETAGNSFFDGNTERGTYQRVLKGIQDGDPEVMDELPFADLSGQWADGLTPESMVREAIGGEIDQYYLEEEGYELETLITEYEDAFSSAAQAVIELTCIHQLA